MVFVSSSIDRSSDVPALFAGRQMMATHGQEGLVTGKPAGARSDGLVTVWMNVEEEELLWAVSGFYG
ncbi:MAG: hypothetical protein Q4D91_08780 [Lautropia sp.]|nr:hypothetical protein [Lautropia sp.]